MRDDDRAETQIDADELDEEDQRRDPKTISGATLK
jgi:hypothetical protein